MLSPTYVRQSEFEKQCERLGLETQAQQKASADLKSWAKKHKDTHFIPTELLNDWGLVPKVNT